MPVGQMLRSMDSAELTDWMAFLSLAQTESPVKQGPADEDEAWRQAFNAYG